ncbi:anaerobic selenocysteine-containing dehydrogenase [Desulfosalsimonas propionicica]|uniref:Anaerobic selenocysteine-containing dehydrogenase n=1 Tax=Desulfosalsimonas propionicica TaxID=332175 RepID=A0A7W0HL91_9BACT|nr:molybdopterin-dependent oxidoreductase [Desulfosalsimonas propionicica]MBA2882035.1 anaerobic selenocysteine-containing dehydrogenase [Desulfosalsimonas propionicica]
MDKRDAESVKQAIGCPMSRRKFLRCLAAAGALAAMPGGLLRSFDAKAGKIIYEGDYEIYRNACPRNCYDTCSIKSYVKDGVLQFIEGAKESTFTDGGLCVKGYAYTRRPYSPDRIKYPMIQDGRGSGNWRRISWDEAMDMIAKKLVEINDKDDSMLGLGLTKYSGNFGITNYAVEGMMTSLGYTTRLVGTPCWPAGIDAQNYDLGDMWCNDPEDMVNSRYIILWGANPAWNSVHTMKYIYAAQDRGAKVVCIDPVFTQTAAKADVYWQVDTSMDGALALGMARHILDKGLFDKAWVEENSVGFNEFADYLRNEITVQWASEKSGIPQQQIVEVAEEFAAAKPATIWIGYGLQRHVNGGATVRSIDALAAMTGNVGKTGGGARYGHMRTWGFNYHALLQKRPEGAKGFLGGKGPKGDFDFSGDEEAEYTDRALNINKTAEMLLTADDPPIRVLWISCKNVLSQDFDRPRMLEAFKKPELIVSVEQFFTQTVELSDIVLPVTTLFEESTINASYWHYWLSVNEQGIKPMYEAKSNTEIAAALSARMNKLKPGSCTFPTEVDTRQWMIKEFNQDIYDLFGIDSWQDLKKGPAKAKMHPASWHDLEFGTPSKKYEFRSDLCAQHGHQALPKFKAARKPYDKLRLLTPHTKFGIHSQFINIDWMEEFNKKPYCYLHPTAASERGITDGDQVRVFNKVGEVELEVKLTQNVPADVVMMYEAWFRNNAYNCQNVVDDTSSDMGKYKTGAPGVAIHDQFADVEKV